MGQQGEGRAAAMANCPSDASFVSAVPTLVITGGWNALYDEVAAALVEAGARHVVLPGFEHRPQDHEQASRILLRALVQARGPADERSSHRR